MRCITALSPGSSWNVDGQRDVPLLVKSAGVVAELHVVPVHRLPFAVVGQELGRLEDLGDEHRALALRRRRQKVQILPDGAANGARNSDVVLESGPVRARPPGDQLRHHGAALDPELPVVAELEVARGVPDDEAAKSLVADQNVGAEPEHEVIESRAPARR